MLHFVTSYMKQNKSRKQTLESAQYGLEISFNTQAVQAQNVRSYLFFSFLCESSALRDIRHMLLHNNEFDYAKT